MIEATEPLGFTIRDRHCKNAKKKSKSFCVVALALLENKQILSVVVGATVTLVTFVTGKVVRYRTPKELREGLISFDRTGKWNLPVGEYEFLPPKKYQTRKAQRKANLENRERRLAGIVVYDMENKRSVVVNSRHMEFLRRQKAA